MRTLTLALLVLCANSFAYAKNIRACSKILQSYRYQAEQWADLSAQELCGSNVRRVSGYQSKAIASSDNGRCDNPLDRGGCVVYNGGWQSCAQYSCVR